MDNYSSEQQSKTLDEELVEINVNSIINYLNNAINSGDQEQIDNLLNEMQSIIDCMQNDLVSFKIIYKLYKVINILSFARLRSKDSEYENVKADITGMIDNINFEKKALISLKKVLKNSKSRKDYDDLKGSFAILIALYAMHDMSTDVDLWNLVVNNKQVEMADMDEFKDIIETGMQKLKI